MSDIIETAIDWLAAGHRVALVTVIATFGSSPRPIGSQLVVNDTDAFEGSVSGGCIESTLVTEAQHALLEDQPQRLSLGVSHDAAWEAGLACGGSMELFVEPVGRHRPILEQLLKIIRDGKNACLATNLETGAKQLITQEKDLSDAPAELRTATVRVLAGGQSRRMRADQTDYFLHGFTPEPQLIIVGAVHIAQPLVRMARLIGYKPLIVDPRKAFATRARFPGTDLICRWPEDAFETIQLHASTAVVVLSHSPRLDDPALVQALRSEAFYIGALGSKKTQAARLARLEEEGVSKIALQRIHGPIGISIGSITPEEIALSIMAEITRSRRLLSGG